MSVERHLRIVTCPSGVLGDSSATELRSGPRRVPGGVWDPSHCASVSWFSFLPTLPCELLRPQGSRREEKASSDNLKCSLTEFLPGNHLTRSVLEYVIFFF